MVLQLFGLQRVTCNCLIKSNRIKILFISTAVLILLLLYFFVFPVYAKYFPKCIFHSLTGLYCPGCGSQRAIASLLHGKIIKAFHFNILLVISLPFIIYAATISVINMFSESKKRLLFFYSPIFSKTVVVIVLLFWITRNIPFYPFNLLSPGE